MYKTYYAIRNAYDRDGEFIFMGFCQAHMSEDRERVIEEYYSLLNEIEEREEIYSVVKLKIKEIL